MKHDFANSFAQSVAKFYEDHGAAFAATRGSAWAELERAAELVKPGMTVVDVGAGNGRFSKLLPDGVTYIGVEPSSTLRAASPTPLIEGGFPNVPVESNFADVTVCFAVFHHLTKEEQAQAVKELLRITKPGGMLVVTSWFLPVGDYTAVEGGNAGDIWVPWKAEGAMANRFVHVYTAQEWQELWNVPEIKLVKSGLFGKADWTNDEQEARNWMMIGTKIS